MCGDIYVLPEGVVVVRGELVMMPDASLQVGEACQGLRGRMNPGLSTIAQVFCLLGHYYMAPLFPILSFFFWVCLVKSVHIINHTLSPVKLPICFAACVERR